MKAQLLRQPRAIEFAPLELADLPVPQPASDELLVRVRACGVCHTDLHTVEGEITGKLPIVPGHQIVGTVEQAGTKAYGYRAGDRVGIPWLHHTCQNCEYCWTERENLCEHAEFTGFNVNGGYAEFATVPASYAVKIPERYDDATAAPLLCAGIVGYRAYQLSEIRPKGRLGLYGFGASAHLLLQVAVKFGHEVHVATRSIEHQRLARELGASWVGRAEDLPANTLGTAIIFAPAGALVPMALRSVNRGGTLVLAGIHMSDIPVMSYTSVYGERTIRSVTNATRDDAKQFMTVAGNLPLRVTVETFPLADANRALLAMKRSELRGAAVLTL